MEIHQGQSWGILELLTRLGDVDNINYRQHQQHMQHKTLLPANRTTVTSSNCSPWGRSDSDHPSSKSGILAVWLLLSFEVQPKAARFKARGAPATPTATPEGDPSKEHRNMTLPEPIIVYFPPGCKADGPHCGNTEHVRYTSRHTPGTPGKKNPIATFLFHPDFPKDPGPLPPPNNTVSTGRNHSHWFAMFPIPKVAWRLRNA
ncbi:hypothetical protein V490_04833 [Pseudogymnoascus sp. VKM F-3557]|nr:hypothetical protein V490_04833 [Pseudogymnoascus sp. VKM F-3557]